MISRILGFFRASFSYLWLVILAVYFSVLTVQSVLRSYHTQNETESLRVELKQKKLEKERLEALLVYYQSADYKETELRRALLMKRPEEAVYALPESSLKPAEEIIIEDPRKAVESLPYWRQWAEYLLGGNQA